MVSIMLVVHVFVTLDLVSSMELVLHTDGGVKEHHADGLAFAA